MAAVSVGTLLTYLVVVALPASAVASSCTLTGVSPDQTLTVQVGTDVSAVFALNGAGADAIDPTIVTNSYIISNNGGNWEACTAALVGDVGLIKVLGADDGVETFTFFHPTGGGFGGDWVSGLQAVATVHLGNGTDSLNIEYGALSPCPADSAVGACADPATADASRWGSVGGVISVDLNATTLADLRIDNAENLRVSGGGGADSLDAGPTSLIGDRSGDVNSPLPGTAVDDIAAVPICSSLTANITLAGGTGDDTLVSGLGNDTLLGGPDVDSVDYLCSVGGVIVDLEAGTGTGMGTDVLSDVQTVLGSDFNDSLKGSSLNNILDGRDGNDVIEGLGGNDTLTGGLDGPDADTSGGNDTLRGGTGNDSVDGGDGDDLIDEEAAANGADTLSGGSGDEVAGDTLDHSKRTVAVAVTAGAGGANDGADLNGDGDSSDAGEEGDNVDATFETYLGGTGADTYVGHGGDETFVPGAGNDKVTGGAGTDMLDVSASVTAATINLETGSATSDQGTDTFLTIETFATGAANDVVIPDITTGLPAGFDWFSDGGIDLIDGSTTTTGFSVDLSNLGGPTGCKAGAGLGLCTDVENATGGSGNDILTGSAISNVLIGGAGFDTIAAGGGNDRVEGGAGNDTLAGGTGADTLVYVNAPSGEVIDLQLGFASGGDGDDAIGFFEIVLGSDFNDQITGGQGTFFDVNLRIRGRGGNDLITGSSSNDTLAGGGGNDTVRGGAGDDILRGAAGNDSLFGSSGDDFLFGGRGTDRGRGGSGDDRCRGVEDKRSC